MRDDLVSAVREQAPGSREVNAQTVRVSFGEQFPVSRFAEGVIAASKGVDFHFDCDRQILTPDVPHGSNVHTLNKLKRNDMRYSFRLAELLGHVPDPRRRPGTIKSIVEYTGLDRHQVAALLKNEVKYIPLKALSRLCDYLIEHGHATAEQLPGALFAVEAENFWEVIARRRRLQFCLGVRRDVETDSPEVCYVVASDSVLLGELLNGATSLGGTAKMLEDSHGSVRHDGEQIDAEGLPATGDSQAKSPPPRPEHVSQSLVWSPGQAPEKEVHHRASEVYERFNELSGDKGLVCLGSAKSNPVVEIVIANAFGCDPFISQDDVKHASDRKCPFFLRYREKDPHPASCFGGTRLSQTEAAKEPGIYFEEANGRWTHCQWESPTQDAAFVFYMHRESQGRLEMTLGGFSGRATRLLANALSRRGEDFWPPVYNDQGISVGAFIVQFDLFEEEGKPTDILTTDLIAEMKVIPLSGAAIERRLHVAAASQ